MIQVALYRGKSALSKAIMWINWSDYSHASLITSCGTEIEAWATGEGGFWQRLTGGKVREGKFGELHTPDTYVEIYDVPGITEPYAQDVETFCRSKVGCPYDWAGVLRFVTRNRPLEDDRWFCSELVAAGFRAAGYPLTNAVPSKTYPGMLATSTRLVRAGEMRTL
jgi:uncharacterized protein YycO